MLIVYSCSTLKDKLWFELPGRATQTLVQDFAYDALRSVSHLSKQHPPGTGEVLRTTTQLLPLCAAGKVLLGRLHLWQTDRFAFKPKNLSVVSADRRALCYTSAVSSNAVRSVFFNSWQANIWFYLWCNSFGSIYCSSSYKHGFVFKYVWHKQRPLFQHHFRHHQPPICP